MSRPAIGLLVILAALASCTSGHPEAAAVGSSGASGHPQAPTAASSSASQVQASASPVQASASPAPSWCTPGFAAAVNGHTPVALEPYLRDSSVIKNLFQQWSLVLAENNMISHPKSIVWLENNAPVTTNGMQFANQDIKKINGICSG